MQRVSNEDESLNEVNVIPLADLSLVLLIILMVISPLVSQGVIQVIAGKANPSLFQEEVEKPETPVIISFEPGALRLNGTLMASELEFVKSLSTLMGNRQEKTATLTVEPTIPHGKAVRVMNLMRLQGVNDLVMLKWDSTRAAEADALQAAGITGAPEPAAVPVVSPTPPPTKKAPARAVKHRSRKRA